jgi:hypothetical protein
MTSSILSTALTLVQKDFELEHSKEELTEEHLLALLEKNISYLLNKDFQKLLQICYRIDLNEKLLKQILHESPPEEITRHLAEAILKRQIQKASIRIKYS